MRLIDADDEKLQGTLKLINEAEIQINGPNRWRFAGQCIDAVAKAPTVEAKPIWIPCSERLPEYYKTVLVTLDNNSVCIVSRVVLFPSNDYVWEDESGDFVQMDEVKAWMPLPDPYEVGGE